jgi:hypothetical protein
MFLGLLSSLPYVSAGNYLCCMWILGGGALAAYMLTRQRSGVTYGDGAFVGVLSGLFGAVITTIASIPMRLLAPGVFEAQQAAIEEAFRDTPEFQGPFRDFILQIASPEVSALTLGFTFFMSVLFYAMFAMIGGIVTVAVLNRKQ